MTEEGIGYDPARGELWFVGEAAEAIQLELEAQFRLLQAQARDLGARAGAAEPRVEARPSACDRARGVSRDRARTLHRGRPAPRGAVFYVEMQTESSRAGELAADLRRLGATEVELGTRHPARATQQVQVELARLDAEADEAPAPGRGRGGARRGHDREELAVQGGSTRAPA